MVQNWWGSGEPPDAIRAITALVPNEDAGNLTVTDLAAVPALEQFILDVSWDEPSMVDGDFWYAKISVGTERLEPGNLGTINVDLVFSLLKPFINVLPLIMRN